MYQPDQAEVTGFWLVYVVNLWLGYISCNSSSYYPVTRPNKLLCEEPSRCTGAGAEHPHILLSTSCTALLSRRVVDNLKQLILGEV